MALAPRLRLFAMVEMVAAEISDPCQLVPLQALHGAGTADFPDRQARKIPPRSGRASHGDARRRRHVIGQACARETGAAAARGQRQGTRGNYCRCTARQGCVVRVCRLARHRSSLASSLFSERISSLMSMSVRSLVIPPPYFRHDSPFLRSPMHPSIRTRGRGPRRDLHERQGTPEHKLHT